MIRSFAHFRAYLYVMAAPVALSAAMILPAFAQSAPLPEVEAALQAVARADQADADQYAPDAIAAARQWLAQAQAAQSGRDKKQAIELSLRASADADLARARSREAVVNADVAHRRAEIAELQRKVSGENGQ